MSNIPDFDSLPEVKGMPKGDVAASTSNTLYEVLTSK